MKYLSRGLAVGAFALWSLSAGCSKAAPETPPPVVEQPAAPASAPAAQSAPPLQNVQQVKAGWDAVTQNIANQNYDNAMRMWAELDRAQRQAQMTEAVRQAYEQQFYQAREALRQKAETDAKAREAYRALGRSITGR